MASRKEMWLEPSFPGKVSVRYGGTPVTNDADHDLPD